MIEIPALRRIVQLLAVATVLTFPQVASAQCAGIAEAGRWRNLDTNGEPSYIDVKMVGGCGDQVLNGVQTGNSTRYTIKVWVKQPTGKFYGRPTVYGTYHPFRGHPAGLWLQGNVGTGGYQDQMWMRVEQRYNQSQLHVFIIHQSLDVKPSYQSEYWFTK